MESVETVIEKMRQEWAAGDRKRDAGLTVPQNLDRYLDLTYGPLPEHRLDVYCPAGTDRKLPTIVSIHGGGWFYGSKQLYSHYCMRLAQRGFAVVNFDYRLAPEAKYPAPLEDACLVLQWIRDKGDAYCIDKDNLFLVGDSAGGQLAFQLLTLQSNPKYREFFPFAPPEEIRFRACGLNCGCYFMPMSRLITPKRAGAIFEAYFPQDFLPWVPSLKAEKYITGDFPPAFVMTAKNDYLRFMAPMLYRKLRSRKVESVLRIYGEKAQKEIGHCFHLNCRSQIADRCNDEQCAFFLAHRNGV